MARLIWTARAVTDVEEIAEYIARDKPDAARGLVSSILASVGQLADFPLIGRSVPELRGSRYREVIASPCRVIYLPTSESVTIVRVIRWRTATPLQYDHGNQLTTSSPFR